MDNQHNQQQAETPEEDKKLKWIVTEHQADFLLKFRQELINQRAYEVLNMTQETMFEAAQAAGFSRGRLALIDELIDAAQVVRPD